MPGDRTAPRADPKPFRVGDYADDHDVDDDECGACWSGFPKRCADAECGGLVHAAFGDEMADGYWLYYKCDRCGADEDPN